MITPVAAATTAPTPPPAPAPPAMEQSPSGLWVPSPPAGAPGAGTVPGRTTETLPSGLVIVRSAVTPSTSGGIVVPQGAVEGAGIVEAARAAHAAIAERDGQGAADAIVGDQLEIAEQVRADEVRAQIVAALMAGDLATAAALAGAV